MAEHTLNHTPRADTIRIEDLLSEVRDGQIRVPLFQRRLRWDERDVALLFDSIWKGYPIGSLLFWARPGDAGPVDLGPLRIDAHSSPVVNWVVDGQQRITSIAATLLSPKVGDRPPMYNLYFDLRKQAFVRPAKNRGPEAYWVPLTAIADTSSMFDWLEQYPYRSAEPTHINIVKGLARRILDYRLPVYIVQAKDDKPLRRIFARLNTTGKAMRESEVFHALLGNAGNAAPTTLEALASRVRQEGLGAPSEHVLLQCIMAIRGMDVSRRLSAHADPSGVLSGAMEEVELPLRLALKFLVGVVGVLHLRLLPYSLALVVLTAFFHIHPSPSRRSKELMSRWVWRGAETGDHGGKNQTLYRKVVKAARVADEDAAVQQLLRLHRKPPHDDWSLARFDTRSAAARLEMMALADLAPRDLRTGQLIDIAALLDEHESRAAQTLNPPKKSERETLLFRTAANRILHPPVGASMGGAVKRFAQQHAGGEHCSVVLSSHGIPQLAVEALLRGDRTGFLKVRADHLKNLVRRHVDDKAAWDLSDRPPIAALVFNEASGA